MRSPNCRFSRYTNFQTIRKRDRCIGILLLLCIHSNVDRKIMRGSAFSQQCSSHSLLPSIPLFPLSVSLFRNQPVKYRPIDSVWVKITTISDTRERAAPRIRILLKGLYSTLKGSLFHFILMIHYSNFLFFLRLPILS